MKIRVKLEYFVRQRMKGGYTIWYIEYQGKKYVHRAGLIFVIPVIFRVCRSENNVFQLRVGWFGYANKKVEVKHD